MAAAKSEGFAVCYCESWNLESFQAVLEAAEESAAPIITGFNGGFFKHSDRPKPECLAYYAGLRLALERSSVPAAFILNETDDLAQILEGMELGFNAIMVESDYLEPPDYLELVKKVVQQARPKGIFVEAQVGRLPHGSGPGHGQTTRPELAHAFVEETGIDALGIAIGNVHILTKGKASIDLQLLSEIHQAVDIPLVIHGGTGFPPEHAQEAINLGVRKFNFGTNLKQAYLSALQVALARYKQPMSPHPFLGMGGREDILCAARAAMKEKVKELLKIYTRPESAKQNLNQTR